MGWLVTNPHDRKEVGVAGITFWQLYMSDGPPMRKRVRIGAAVTIAMTDASAMTAPRKNGFANADVINTHRLM